MLDLIQSAHALELQVYADLVFNRNSGADAQELNPIDGQSRWTKFTPKSGKFLRDWKCFHPSQYETWDGATFGEMPDLCHRTPLVYTELINYARWLLEEVGFDGFRYDMVKGYGGWMVRSIQKLRALRGGTSFEPYAVGECWDSERTIDDWLAEANAWSDNPVGAFDFPLRWRLRDLYDSYGFSNLAERGVLGMASSRTKVIPVSSCRITLTGTSPSRTIKAGSTRSSRFTSKMRAARLSCFS